MPRVNAPAPNAEFDMMTKQLNSFRDLWVKLQQEAEVDPVKFSRLSVVALTQLAAIVAVDVGMPAPNFTAVCNAQFKAAHAKAPKFS